MNLDRRPPRGRVALMALGVVLALVVAEGTVRLFHLGPPSYHTRRIVTPGGIPIRPLGNDLFIYEPGARFTARYDPAGDRRRYFGADGRIEYRINSFGLRGPDVSARKQPGSRRILCLGDSFTFGEGVHEPDTYPARIAQILNETPLPRDGALRPAHPEPGQDGPVEVINAGVQAFDTSQEAALLRRMLSFEPDVVLLGFVLNDCMEGSRTIGIQEAMQADAAPTGLARLSRLWDVTGRALRARRLQSAYLAEMQESFRSERWERCKAEIERMGALGREKNFRLVVVVFPLLWELDGDYPLEGLHDRVRQACLDAGVECLDLLPVFRGRSAPSLWVHPTDQHPNEIAHGLAAQALARYLSEC